MRYFVMDEFDFVNELMLSVGIVVISIIVLVIADLLRFRGGDTIFMLPDNIEKSIAKDIFRCSKVPDQRGLFISTPKFSENVLQYVYTPIANPAEFYYKAFAYINVLHSLNTAEADRMIDKISELQEEAKYMSENPRVPTLIKNLQ